MIASDLEIDLYSCQSRFSFSQPQPLLWAELRQIDLASSNNNATAKLAERPSVGSNAWPIGLTVGLVGVSAGGAYLSFPYFSGLTPEVVAGLGTSLTVWGLVIAVGGLAITVWQLIRTRGAAVAANAATARLKRQFGSFDVLLEVRSAWAASQEAQTHVSGSSWAAARFGLTKLRSSFAKVLEVPDGMAEEDKETIRDYLGQALAFCDDIERIEQDATMQIDKISINSKLRELDDFLVSLEVKIKDRFSAD